MRISSILALTLAATACQKVRVFDDTTGRPIENAGVDVRTSVGSRSQRTGSDGTAWLQFPDSNDGPVTVRVCRWLYAPTAVRFSSSAQVPRPLLMRLRPDPSDTGEARVNARCDAVKVGVDDSSRFSPETGR